MKPSHILSIDPGVHGALCLLNLSDRSIQVFDIPILKSQVDGVQLAALIDMCKVQAANLCAVVENVNGRPGQGHVFAFGLATGKIHGILDSLGIFYETVAPAQWKPAMGLRRLANESQSQNKARARTLAAKLWPRNAADFERVKNHDRAEAALLGRFYAAKKGWL